MASSARSQVSPKFKEGDIVAYPDWERCLQVGYIYTTIYKIDCVEMYGRCGDSGLYRCRVWGLRENKWIDTRDGEMRGNDGRAIFFWSSRLEQDMEVIEPLGLLVKWGIG
jgi:hypothetical protein